MGPSYAILPLLAAPWLPTALLCPRADLGWNWASPACLNPLSQPLLGSCCGGQAAQEGRGREMSWTSLLAPKRRKPCFLKMFIPLNILLFPGNYSILYIRGQETGH